MARSYVVDKNFSNRDYSEKPPESREYEYCTFSKCIFSNADLSGIKFIECVFEGCDLSNAKIADTAFRDVQFKSCKLLGLHFDDCNTFNLSFTFDHCILNYSSFFNLKLKNLKCTACMLEEVDFTQADLSGASFMDCDLKMSIFENSNLVKADFRSTINYTIDPERNKIKNAKFSIQGIPGLLFKYNISIE